jgi:hypothetical protein
MAHVVSKTDHSPEENLYLGYIQKADDFMKIEIYRSAKEWYTRALELKKNDDLIRAKLDKCNTLIQQEKRRILIIVSVIAIVTITLVLLWK